MHTIVTEFIEVNCPALVFFLQDFKESTNDSLDFIDSAIEDPIEKATCCTHVVSELTSHRQTIRPRRVAQDYFPVDQQKPYLEHLDSRGIPANQFDKDTALVERRLKRILLEFTHGVQILAPAETYGESVTLEQLDGGNTRAEVIGKIKSVKSK